MIARRLVSLAAAVLTLAQAGPASPQRPSGGALLIEHVTIADPSRPDVAADQDVLVRDGRIVSVGAARDVPRGTTRVDARGKFLIPGLADMHVHDAGRAAMPLYVLNGVTLVRAMGGEPLSFAAYRRDIRAGALVGPTIVSAGLIFESRRWLVAVKPMFDFRLRFRVPYATAYEAEELLRLFGRNNQDLGMDFIKVRNVPSMEVLAGFIAAGRRRGLETAGHEPWGALLEGIEAGMKSVEHLPYIALSPLGRLTDADLPRVIEAARRNGTVLVPTIVAAHTRLNSVADVRARLAKGDPRDRFVAKVQMEKWRQDLDAQERETNQPDWGAMTRHSFGQLRAMAAAGVPVAAGTDVGFVGIYPGFSLHDELEQLAGATGMSPREVLLMGTANAARLAGLWAETGSVEPGKRADLVLLDANPFEDVRNVRRIHAVVLGGRYLGPRDLETLRGEVVAHKDDAADYEGEFAVEPASVSDPARLARIGTYWLAEGSYARAAGFFRRAQELGPSTEGALGLFLASFNDLTEKAPATTMAQLVERAAPVAVALDDDHRVDLTARVVQLAAQRKEAAALAPLMGPFGAIDPGRLAPASRVAWHGAMATYLAASDPAAAYAHKVETMPAGWRESAEQLNAIAWWAFENSVELEAARRHAEEGVRLAAAPSLKASIIDTLAEIRNAQGFPAEALELERQAEALAPSDFFKKQVKRFEELAAKAGTR